jgi:hypothetical protein
MTGRRSGEFADRIGYIFPVVDADDNTTDDAADDYDIMINKYNNMRYIHIDKVIVYERKYNHQTHKHMHISKFNIMRAYTSCLSRHFDSSDSYSSEEEEDENESHIYGEI